MVDGIQNIGRRADDKWHVGKEIPLSVIVSLIIVLISNVAMWSAFKAEVQIFMNQTDMKFSSIEAQHNKNREDIYRDISEKTRDRVYGATVKEMFNTRDVQLHGINSTLIDVKSSMSALNDQIHELRRDLTHASKRLNEK